MDSIAELHSQPLRLSLNPIRQSLPKPISFLSFKAPSRPLKFSASIIRASSSSFSSSSQAPNKPSLHLQSVINPILKTTCITLTAAAALLLTRLPVKPAIAISVPVASSSTEDPTAKKHSSGNVPLGEQEMAIEERLARNPDDIEALRALMEVRIKSRKLQEAIEVIDRLIELEPEEDEWPLLKAQIYSYSGDFDSARKGFEEILNKDPYRVEAYHGLLMANSESGDSLKDVVKRIEMAMDKCKKEKKKSDLRDFKLLIGQVRVMEEKYGDALKVYEELVKEEPRDFRPYLCQGIIYTLMRKRDEAEKKFEQFRKLVPKNHPYREYFLDNMFATKFFSEKVERERVGSRS